MSPPAKLRVPMGEACRHRNGVTGVAGVTAAVRDLGTSTARYRALLGQAPTSCGGVPGLGFGLSQFQLGGQMLSLAAPQPGGADALSQHLGHRGQGIFAVSFHGPDERGLDPVLAHGARLEIVRSL